MYQFQHNHAGSAAGSAPQSQFPPPTYGSWPPPGQSLPPQQTVYQNAQHGPPAQQSLPAQYGPPPQYIQPSQQPHHYPHQQYQKAHQSLYSVPPPGQPNFPSQQIFLAGPIQQSQTSVSASHHGNGNNQHATKNPSQSCYNCGRTDHWAQSCPESRRAVPAGSMNQQRPFKKQKTMPAVVTRYAPPPFQQGTSSLHRGNTYPPLDDLVTPPSTAPPRRVLSQSGGYNYWQAKNFQSSPPPPHQGVYQPQSPSHPTRQGSHPWTPSKVATPNAPYEPHFAVSVVTNDHQPSLPASAFHRPSPTVQLPVSSPSPYHFEQRAPPPLPVTGNTNAYPQSLKVSIVPKPVEPMVEIIEPWLAELQELDFPEGKSGNGPIISHPANPVAQPLPSDSAEADSIGRLPIAASLPPGVSVSRYFRDLNQDVFDTNIRQRIEWSHVSLDPMFSDIASKCEIISVSGLINRCKEDALAHIGNDEDQVNSDSDYESNPDKSDREAQQQKSPYNASIPGSQEERRSGRLERPVNIPQNGGHDRDHDDYTHSHDEMYHDPGSARRPIAEFESYEDRFAREQEEKLAALGVSGIAKPIQPSVRRSVAIGEPLGEVALHIGNGREPQRRSQSYEHSPSNYDDTNVPNTTNIRGSWADDHTQDHTTPGSRGGYSPRAELQYTHSLSHSSCTDDREPEDRSQRDRHAQLDPPAYDRYHAPPPPRDPWHFNDQRTLQTSPTDTQQNETPQRGPIRSPSSHAVSKDHANNFSSERTGSYSNLIRKRSYRHSSEESDSGPRRQEDEHTLRHKRKQPRIAAAYSRRW